MFIRELLQEEKKFSGDPEVHHGFVVCAANKRSTRREKLSSVHAPGRLPAVGAGTISRIKQKNQRALESKPGLKRESNSTVTTNCPNVL
jgi:hypothetical protein